MALWNGKALNTQELAFWFNEADHVMEQIRELQKPSTDYYEEPAPQQPESDVRENA